MNRTELDLDFLKSLAIWKRIEYSTEKIIKKNFKNDYFVKAFCFFTKDLGNKGFCVITFAKWNKDKIFLSETYLYFNLF